MHETVVASRFLCRNVIGDLEVLDLAGDSRSQLGNIEGGDGADSAAAVANGIPGGSDRVPHGGDETQACDDYAT